MIIHVRNSDAKESKRRKRGKRILGVLTVSIALVLVVLSVSIPHTSRVHTKKGIRRYADSISTVGTIGSLSVKKVESQNPCLFSYMAVRGCRLMVSLRLRNSILERYYTVVYRGQRGTGYSWDPRLSREDMKIEAFVSDLHELIFDVKAELGTDSPVNLLAFF